MADEGVAALAAERESASFPVREMSHFLYGGEQEFETHSRMAALVEQDPAFSKRRRHFMSRAEAYTQSLRKSRRFHEVATAMNLSRHERDLFRVYIDEQLPVRGRRARRRAPRQPWAAHADQPPLCDVHTND